MYEMVVRKDYWRQQIKVKQKLGLKVEQEEIAYAYREEVDAAAEKINEVWDKIKDTICELAEKLKEVFGKYIDDDIDGSPQVTNTGKKKNRKKEILIENRKFTGKSNMRFVDRSINKSQIRCRNNCRK